MKLLDVVTSPWAIQSEKLIEIRDIYATHMRGEKIDIAGVEARLGRPLKNEPKSYDVIDGVAVLRIEGVMAKRANLFMQISGGTSTEIAARELRDALDDPEVHSIILEIDSPGGTVDGTQALGDLVVAARQTKPIVALANGCMCSAAYWVGSAASKVYIADRTTNVGSIGVVATHVDVSKAEEQSGYKTTEITAGKYKRSASEYAPLTEDGRATIQERVDYLYSIFVGAVAKQRGVSEEKVLQDMADGRVFIGEQAIAAGLVDGVSTLDALIRQLNENRAGAAQTIPSATSKGTAMSLTREQIEAAAPDLVKAFRAEGAAAECERIKGVEAQLIPGHEALINSMKFDGASTAGDAALAVNAAERKLRDDAAKASGAQAPQPVPQAPAPAAGSSASDDASMPIEQRAKATWDKDANLRAEFGGSFSAYLAYAKADQAGQVRILKSSKE
jgi:signal peptide peptidase SppA